MAFQHNPPFGGAFTRRFTRYSGIYFDDFADNSAWIRETGVVRLPPMENVKEVVIRGEFIAHPMAKWPESGFPSLEAFLDGRKIGSATASRGAAWEMRATIEAPAARRGSVLYLCLKGVDFTNAMAWLGRVTNLGPLQRYRAQNRNRQLRLVSIESDSGETIYDFSKRESPYSTAFARSHSSTGMNIVGFLTAELGIGESARCMARSADAAGVPVSLVPLKLNCRNRLGDQTYADRLTDSNPYGANVFHIDPPVARDIDHHHGPDFRRGKYNIGYFAWELPEFPDSWLPSFDYLDEIWCPSDFVRSAIELKALFPVITMPHSVAFERPTGDKRALRAQFGLDPSAYLFLSLFDLNSYTARKNPGAVVAAFRASGLAGKGASLVLKVQNAESNPSDFEALKASVADLEGCVLLSGTFSRPDVYALEAACDCFVSLHRSEGFGLAVAECMYLGKPVISTDWSATAEYLNRQNGYPVRFTLATLSENFGPYTKGSLWAEPDIDHAAELMGKVARDPAAAERMGAAAKATIEGRFSPAVVGARYRRRLEALASL